MKIYLLLLAIALAVPLALSFEPRVRFYQKVRLLFPSILVVAAMFLFWDIVAVSRGDWAFNPDYLLPFRFAGIPLEEILFFIVIPYCCLFTYECVLSLRADTSFRAPAGFFVLVAAVAGGGAFSFMDQKYTSTVLAVCCLSLLVMEFVKPALLRSVNYWIFILITYVPFMAVNSVLTSAPVVTYNSQAIWGLRLMTIPLEDFFYSYTLISLATLMYVFLRDRAALREQVRKSVKELSSLRRVL